MEDEPLKRLLMVMLVFPKIGRLMSDFWRVLSAL
jgi:hypothetical protein